jgi:hypothetical protein
VFALKSAFLIVFGVLVITLTGFASIFKVDNIPNCASVIITSKDVVGFVVAGFYIPLILNLNGCKGFIPLRPDLMAIWNLTAFLTNAS